MVFVYTIFDPKKDGKPLISGTYDADNPNKAERLRFHLFWIKGTGRTLKNVEDSIKEFESLLSGRRVIANDAKQHLVAFNFNRTVIFDPDICNLRPAPEIRECHRNITRVLAQMNRMRPKRWHLIRAQSCEVYAYLQQRGVLYNYNMVYPTWGRTWAGRSKTSDPSIQNLQGGLLANPNKDDYYINFDWVAADMRAISIMSQDPKLQDSFDDADPYEHLKLLTNRAAKKAGAPWGLIDRDAAKGLMFRTIYSLDESEDRVMAHYDGFKRWMGECKQKMRRDGYLSSILGRRFHISHERDAKSVFNATVQGSIAHAMQICIKRVWDQYPDKILVENHDSLVVTARKEELALLISDVASIMVQPFWGILKDNPQFPVRVSVGRKYRDWKLYKRYNTYEQIN